MSPEEILKILKKIKRLYSLSEIEHAMDQMAIEMKERLIDKNPIFICLLTGAMVSFGNLLPRLDFPLEIDYAHTTRYGKDFKGSKDLLWKAVPTKNMHNRTVVLFDDILDEGLTLTAVMEYCRNQGASEVLSAVLLDKKKKRSVNGVEKANFACFEIEDVFVFGYGLDYKGYFRNLPGVYILNS